MVAGGIHHRQIQLHLRTLMIWHCALFIFFIFLSICSRYALDLKRIYFWLSINCLHQNEIKWKNNNKKCFLITAGNKIATNSNTNNNSIEWTYCAGWYTRFKSDPRLLFIGNEAGAVDNRFLCLLIFNFCCFIYFILAPFLRMISFWWPNTKHT